MEHLSCSEISCSAKPNVANPLRDIPMGWVINPILPCLTSSLKRLRKLTHFFTFLHHLSYWLKLWNLRPCQTTSFPCPSLPFQRQVKCLKWELRASLISMSVHDLKASKAAADRVTNRVTARLVDSLTYRSPTTAGQQKAAKKHINFWTAIRRQ